VTLRVVEGRIHFDASEQPPTDIEPPKGLRIGESESTPEEVKSGG
jgi:hypothetical protein